jgi:hypothetical protein
VTEFPVVVCMEYVFAREDAVPQESLVDVVFESPNPNKLNPVVWLVVETLSLVEFVTREWDEPTKWLFP